MKWKKLGKIFDPTKYTLPNHCVEYARSPQALVFDNFVRIYFSTAAKDNTGKLLSHIAFVDMDKKFKEIIKVSDDTVIRLGNLGCFDEHGIFPMNVIRDGQKIMAFTGGMKRKVSVPLDGSIGYAYSEDNGLTFKRLGEGPVVSSSLNEPFLIGDPFVAKFRNIYHMWYIHGTKWKRCPETNTPDRVYKIAHAVSNDGISWQKEGKLIISDKLNEDECQALPSVISFNGGYHMVFCYREATDFKNNKNRSYRLGYAYSDDLINWTRDDNKVGIDVSEEGWDSQMQCYPNLFHCDGRIYMLYNGNEFGRHGFGLAILEDVTG